MEQPWNQQREGIVGYAMGESSCHAADLDHQAAVMTTTDRYEVDGAFLMELIMEDLPSSSDLLLDGDIDRQQLSRVIRSLEAEIGGAGVDHQASVAMVMGDEGGEGLGRIEDVLSSDDDDMDGYNYEGASSFLAAGHDDQAEGWCVYTNAGYESGSVLGYDTMVDHQYYYYCSAEGSAADHMYLPLWE